VGDLTLSAIIIAALVFTTLGVFIGWNARALWGGDYRAGMRRAFEILQKSEWKSPHSEGEQ
jgi:hypothetical protein